MHTKSGITQGVGVVLSGGGATGLAHIGVLQALEDNEIPIDYIGGTSMGSLIGALYASGYSPQEIKEYIVASNFDKMNSRETPKEERFLLREKDKDASMISFKIAKDSIFKKSLPTHFVTPSAIDLHSFEILGHTGAHYNKDFDSLFVPFRCVAADVYKKEMVIFREGDLNAAVRASMTYPFYINPIRVDGRLLFDGGLYNNFPADVIYDDFQADYLIGSNVSYNDPPPTEDDLLSQLSTMFVQKTDFTLPCENGVIIEPKNDVGTFDFSKIDRAVESGYIAAQKYIDSILPYMTRRVTKEELKQRRKEFRSQITPLKVNEIEVNSHAMANVSFVRSNFIKDTLKTALPYNKVKERYFQVIATPHIRHVFPTLDKTTDSTYKMKMAVTKQRPFALNLGGHFSTRSVSTAYLGVSYYDIGLGAVGLHAESYFGKFYTSFKFKVDYDLPTVLPLRMSPYVLLNRWDYYKSNSTFFQDAEPSFLLQNELQYGVELAGKVKNNSKIALDLKKFQNRDQYYQTLNYSESDTADVTRFDGETVLLKFEHNTLNRKQWASEGSQVSASFRYVQGKEKSISGNTPENEYDLRRHHRWISLTLEAQKYFKVSSFFKIGLYGNAVFNSQSLFGNYTASLLALTEFSPLPDSRTIFLEEYRAAQFVGAGLNLVFNYKNFLELRIDPYFFQPFKMLKRNENNSADYVSALKEGVPMAGASLIFHSPIGPVRFSTNWFPRQSKPFMVQAGFGYVIFNKRSIR